MGNAKFSIIHCNFSLSLSVSTFLAMSEYLLYLDRIYLSASKIE